MASSPLNWSGSVLLIIGFALILAAIIYIESRKVVNTTFRVLLGVGIALLLLGVIMIFAGHWSVFFPVTKVVQTVPDFTKLPTVVMY